MQIEQKAAETLLNKGIKVRVTAPFLLKMVGIRTVGLTIKAPCLGTLYRISQAYLSSGLTTEELEKIDEASAHELFMRQGRTLARIAALAWLNGNRRGRLFAGIVSRWLYWHLTPVQLVALFNVLVVLSGTTAFTNTIRLAATMRMTAPTLSQEVQGS